MKQHEAMKSARSEPSRQRIEAHADTPKIGSTALVKARGDLGKGTRVFRARCSACHLATSTTVRVGPGLKGLFQREMMVRTGLAPTEENVRKVISDGSGAMPPFWSVLTRDQMDDLIAYLKTL